MSNDAATQVGSMPIVGSGVDSVAERYTLGATYVSPGALAGTGGIIIVGGHVIKVPNQDGRRVELMRELLSSMATLEVAAHIADRETRRQIQASAARLVEQSGRQLAEYITSEARESLEARESRRPR